MTDRKAKVIDYTKMQLGLVTRTFKGRRVAVVARCPKCGRRGERSVSMPEKGEGIRGRKPSVHVTHVLEVKAWGDRRVESILGHSYGYVKESCTVAVDATNVGDLLNLEERRRYDAFVAELRAYVEAF